MAGGGWSWYTLVVGGKHRKPSKEMTVMSILEVRGLKKVYTTRFGGAHVQALTDVTFAVEEGEYVAIMGESGSGKTTR